jgi:hypothetical protein
MWLETKDSPLLDMLSKIATLTRKVTTLRALQQAKRAEAQLRALSSCSQGKK